MIKTCQDQQCRSRQADGSRGFILALGLLLMAALALIGTAALTTASFQNDLANNVRSSHEVYYASSVGLGQALEKMTYLRPPGNEITISNNQVYVVGWMHESSGDYTALDESRCVPDASGKLNGAVCSCPYAAQDCVLYYVEVVFKKQGSPPAGWDLNVYNTLYYQLVSSAVGYNGSSKRVGVFVGTVLPKQYGTGGSGGGS